MTRTEVRHRRFIATDETRSLEERREISRSTGSDPGAVFGRVEVQVDQGTPPAMAAKMLRAIAADLEQEG